MDAAHALSDIENHAGKECKADLGLVGGRLNACGRQRFHPLMKEESLPLMLVQATLGMKGPRPVIGVALIEGCHYNGGSNPITSNE